MSDNELRENKAKWKNRARKGAKELHEALAHALATANGQEPTSPKPTNTTDQPTSTRKKHKCHLRKHRTDRHGRPLGRKRNRKTINKGKRTKQHPAKKGTTNPGERTTKIQRNTPLALATGALAELVNLQKEMQHATFNEGQAILKKHTKKKIFIKFKE